MIIVLLITAIIIISVRLIYSKYLNWKFITEQQHIVKVWKYDYNNDQYILIETNEEQREQIKKYYIKLVNFKIQFLSIKEVWQSDWIIQIDETTIYLNNNSNKMLVDTENWHNTVNGAIKLVNYLNSLQ